MVQGGRGGGLAPEPLTPVDVAGELLGQDLDRHHPLETRVPGPVDLAETSGAEKLEDLEMIERRPEAQGRGARDALAGTG